MARTSAASSTAHDLANRLKALRAAVVGAGADGLLVTNPKDVGYLTGFLGGDSWLVVGAKRAVLISDFRFQEELEPLNKAGTCEVLIRSGTILEAIGTCVGELGIKSLGVQGEHMTLVRRSAVAKVCKGVKIVETSGLVPALRIVKSDAEVALIRKAVKIQEKALEAALLEADGWIKKRGSFIESQFAACLEYHMTSLGSPEPSFGTIAGAGKNGSLPHYRAGAGKIKPGVPLLIDWGATYQGYHGDMTRVVCWGGSKKTAWPKKIVEIFHICEEAHWLAVDGLHAGANSKEVDALARNHIARYGYGPQFGHSLGHGVGLDIHEDPGLRSQGDGVELKAGMVVTIEPGIYLPGVGGVRLENDYVITDKGCTNLCSLDMDMKWSTR